MQTAVGRLWRELGQNPTKQERAREELMALGDAALPELQALILQNRLERDADAVATKEAVQKIAETTGDALEAAAKPVAKAGLAAEQPLKELMERGELDQAQTDCVAELLQNIDTKRQYLLQAAHVPLQAVEAIGLIGSEDALAILREEAEGPEDDPITQAACGVLARRKAAPQEP